MRDWKSQKEDKDLDKYCSSIRERELVRVFFDCLNVKRRTDGSRLLTNKKKVWWRWRKPRGHALLSFENGDNSRVNSQWANFFPPTWCYQHRWTIVKNVFLLCSYRPNRKELPFSTAVANARHLCCISWNSGGCFIFETAITNNNRERERPSALYPSQLFLDRWLRKSVG